MNVKEKSNDCISRTLFRVTGVIKSAGPPSAGWQYCLETFHRYN